VELINKNSTVDVELYNKVPLADPALTTVYRSSMLNLFQASWGQFSRNSETCIHT